MGANIEVVSVEVGAVGDLVAEIGHSPGVGKGDRVGAAVERFDGECKVDVECLCG